MADPDLKAKIKSRKDALDEITGSMDAPAAAKPVTKPPIPSEDKTKSVKPVKPKVTILNQGLKKLGLLKE